MPEETKSSSSLVMTVLASPPTWVSLLLLTSLLVIFLLWRLISHCYQRYRINLSYKEVPTSIPAIHVTIPSSNSSSGVLMAPPGQSLREAYSPPWMNGGAHRTHNTVAPSPDAVLASVNGLFLFDEEDCADEQDMDDRSVLHYELGMYEKTSSSCFRGTLTFALRYDFVHRVLMLHVVRANNLPIEEKGQTMEPYVKMHLLPERKNHCKTKICRRTRDPEFNEMTVYDFERFTRHGLVGHVIMRDLFDRSDLYTWTEYTMQIVASQEKNDFGDLLLYLSYSYAEQKLSIQVAKAYNLRPMDITGASDPYVKIEQVYLGRRVKLRKSTTKRANLNPVYHETLEFELPSVQINETNMLIQVMDWDRIGKDDLLGCCVLGRKSTTPEGRNQWDQCFAQHEIGQATVVKPKPVGQWHSILGEIPEDFRNIPKAKK